MRVDVGLGDGGPRIGTYSSGISADRFDESRSQKKGATK